MYCDLAKIKFESLRQVATHGMDDHFLKLEDFEEPGHLSLDAAKIIMKALYGARLVFLALLWPICQRARSVEMDTGMRQALAQTYVLHTPHSRPLAGEFCW